MYNWRKMTPKQKEYVLEKRKEQKRPFHSLPHFINHEDNEGRYHISAACYEHKSIINSKIYRLATFEKELLKIVSANTIKLYCYSILPNHYHILVETDIIKELLKVLFRLHKDTALCWNKEDNSKGRKVWCNAFESQVKSEKYFWATVNYIHNNPVKHGYVAKWQEWPYSSADDFIENEGWEKTLYIWNKYDSSKMCKWDI